MYLTISLLSTPTSYFFMTLFFNNFLVNTAIALIKYGCIAGIVAIKSSSVTRKCSFIYYYYIVSDFQIVP